MVHVGQTLTENLEKYLVIRDEAGKIQTIVYRVPIRGIALEMSGGDINDEALCIEEAEKVLMTLEIVTKHVLP
jgi:hypothetical protein